MCEVVTQGRRALTISPASLTRRVNTTVNNPLVAVVASEVSVAIALGAAVVSSLHSSNDRWTNGSLSALVIVSPVGSRGVRSNQDSNGLPRIRGRGPRNDIVY